MKRASILLVFGSVFLSIVGCSDVNGARTCRLAGRKTSERHDLKNLYAAHRWFDLREGIERNEDMLLYHGAVAAAFARSEKTEKLLQAVIEAAPKSEDARQAHEWLAHFYIQTGHYAQLAGDLQKQSTDFSNDSECQRRHAALEPLLDLPDQRTLRSGFATVKHDGGVFSPLTINGRDANYFFDTGAGISAMSESEAKRLGMTIEDKAGKMGTSTGYQTRFRTAVAQKLQWGALELQNVSFAVFPDNQEPWKDLLEGRQGLIGIPVLLAAERIRWSHDGTIEIGAVKARQAERKPNLCFDEDQLIAVVSKEGHDFWMRLDTGAVETELWKGFADAYPDLIRARGREAPKAVHGIGHAETVQAVSLPVLKLGLGGTDVKLRPAVVLLNQPGPERCWGNIGNDLLKQATSFEIDFRAMALELRFKR
jgi:predicted aspartyl protease